MPVDGGRQVEPVGDVDGDRGLLRHLDEGAGILPVEAVHGERAAVDGAPDESGLQIERAAVAEPHHLARPRRRRRLRRRRQERVDGRGEAAEARHHRHRRMHRRARPPAGGRRRRGVPDHPGQRQQILRLHPHPGRGASQHDAALPRGRRRVRLGGDEYQELVQVDRSERRAAVRDRSQVPDRPQPRRGRPGDVAVVVAERGRVRQPVDVQDEVEPVAAVDGDGGAERRRRRGELDVSRRAGEVGGVDQRDAVQIRVGRRPARIQGGTPQRRPGGLSGGRRRGRRGPCEETDPEDRGRRGGAGAPGRPAASRPGRGAGPSLRVDARRLEIHPDQSAPNLRVGSTPRSRNVRASAAGLRKGPGRSGYGWRREPERREPGLKPGSIMSHD